MGLPLGVSGGSSCNTERPKHYFLFFAYGQYLRPFLPGRAREKGGGGGRTQAKHSVVQCRQEGPPTHHHGPHLNHVPLHAAVPPAPVRLGVAVAIQAALEHIIIRLLVGRQGFSLPPCPRGQGTVLVVMTVSSSLVTL